MSTQLIRRFAAIEQQLDTVLFRNDDDRSGGGGLLTGAALAGGGIYGAQAVGRAVEPLTTAKRGVLATLRKRPDASIAAIGSTIAGDLKGVGSKIAGGARSLWKGAKGLFASAKGCESVIALAAKIEATEFAGGGLSAAIIGNPATAAINARPGKKLDAYGEAYGHQAVNQAIGGVGGGAIGAGIGALAHNTEAAAKLRKLMRVRKGLGRGGTAAIGTAGGLLAGSLIGAVKGNFDRKAREIRTKYA